MTDTISIKLVHQNIEVEQNLDFVRNDSAGAINAFLGAVRNQTKGEAVKHLFFEGYEPMAIKEMEKLAIEAQKRWNLLRVVIVHRLGKVEISELAVLIAVSSPHRKASFEACEFLINTLKKTVPIWKLEYFKNGQHWVNSHP
jgi:molybdopterin synthase catalytic subunit